ncbi:DUF3857 domain-containing protein [Rubritalea spongiae]|uniref:DUF3857 domain-containing protein n=1 Tax=Rubritalea spongiae TaxID=430797 RepID=UPI003622CCB5
MNINELQIAHKKATELLVQKEHDIKLLHQKLENLSSAAKSSPTPAKSTDVKKLNSAKHSPPKLSQLFLKMFKKEEPALQTNFTFERENFTISLPKNSTLPMPESFVPEGACFAIRFKHSNVYCVITVEEDPHQIFKDGSQLNDLVISNIEANSTNFKLSAPHEIPHPAGTIYSSTCKVNLNNNKITYRPNSLISNGRAYQILLWSTHAEEKKLHEKNKMILDCFTILDPENRIEQSSSPPTKHQDIQLPELGISIQLSKLNASPYLTLDDDYPNASAGYQGDDNDGGVVFLADVEGLNLSDETIIYGCLNIEKIPPNHASLEYLGQKIISQNTVKQYSFTYTSNDELWYCRVDISQHQGKICVHSAWALSPKKIPPADSFWTHFNWTSADLTKELSSETNKQIAHNINQIGLYAYKVQHYHEAEKCFAEAHRLVPKDSVYGANWIRSFTASDRYSSALSTANTVIKTSPSNLEVRALKAYILVQLNQTEKAFKIYEDLFLSKYQDDDDLLDFLNALLDAHEHQRGADFMRRYTKLYPSPKMKRWMASMLRSNKEYLEAIEILTLLINESPKNEPAIELLIEVHEEQEQYELAMQWVKKLQKLTPNAIAPQLTEARILRSKGSHLEAYNLLSTLNQKYPEDSNVQEMYSIASARLGLGDHSSLRSQITPVEVENELLQRIRVNAKIAHPDEANHPAHYIKAIKAFDFNKNGTLTTTYYYTVKVTSSSGVEHFKNWHFNFDPSYEEIFVNTHTVYAADGSIAHKGKVSEYFISDEESNMEDTAKELTIPNVGIEIGSTIELVLSKRTFSSEKDHFPFKQLYLTSSYPQRINAITINSGDSHFHKIIKNGVKHSSSQNAEHFWVSHPKVYHSEDYMPNSEELFPFIYIGSNSRSWSDISNEYYQYIKERFEEDKHLNEAIDNILSLHSDKKEQVTACIQWVQAQCNYRAIEFGPRGRMPKPAIKTFKGKEGDCKDMSLLLWHMLKRIGLSPSLALANTDTEICPELPDENQFNHIVLYCPELNDNPVLDPTHEHLNLLASPPSNLLNNYILPISNTPTKLVAVKSTPASINVYQIIREVREEKNSIVIEETLTSKHFAAAYLRSRFQGQSKRRKKETLHRWFSDFYPSIRIESVKFDAGLNDNYKDLNLTIQYRYPTSSLNTFIPVPWENFYFEWSQANERINPLFNLIPVKIHSTTNRPSQLLDSHFSSSFTLSSFNSNPSSSHYSSVRKSFHAPASDYDTFRKELSNLIPKIPITQQKTSPPPSN